MLTTLALALPIVVPGGDSIMLTDDPLIAFAKRVAGATTGYAELTGAPGAPVMLFAHPADEAFDPNTALPVFTTFFDPAGHASAAVAIPEAMAQQDGLVVGMTAVYLWNGQLWQSQGGEFLAGTAGGAQLLDFDFAPGFTEPALGQQIDDEYSELGITVNAINNTGGPNIAIVFDSGNPTGGDTDLATPGPGTGNDEALGQLLIIAENDFGAEDGFVDDPDDEQAGGLIGFGFDLPTDVVSVRLVDIDDQMPSEIRIVQDGIPGMTAIPVNDVGDNGVQEVVINAAGVTQLDVYFGGSGAVADILFFPCPIIIDFNETPTGVPIDLPAGTVVTDQLASLGVLVSATGGAPGFPDLGIIFDSGNPTGNDPDLATPGPGNNNDEFLGNLLIVSEDPDTDGDGVVETDPTEAPDGPDDSVEGGTLRFDFVQNVTFFGFKVIDVDSEEQDLAILYDEFGAVILIRDIGPIEDNSVQDIVLGGPDGVAGVRAFELILAGSGGVDSLRYCIEDDIEVPQ